MQKWSDTKIWDAIKNSHEEGDKAIQTFLETRLPNVEIVLTSGGTSPQSFTLHDAGHAYRVAEKMASIVDDQLLGELCTYELALLLLSAYLHDIGMTPEERKVINHYNYLLTGDQTKLSPDDIEKFSQWLDDDESGVLPPIAESSPTLSDLELVRKLITHYCRYRHNDWSEEWIRKNLPCDEGIYSEFQDDLILICKSHHYGRTELEQKRFDPKIVGQHGEVVHLRYLACVLRIADILEFDPERTPEVIFRHRDIAEDSLIYWHKDHDIAFAKEQNRLVLTARPKNAIIHRAIEETCDQIDEELQMCRMLADSKHFEKCPGLQRDLPHKWMLVSTLHRDLEAREGAYEYINGAFRPNTQKILEMFSGIELYENPLNSVRELLQNAFDAVREQIAYVRLKQHYPSDKQLSEKLGQLNRVELRLERQGEDYWLLCSDTGVGMNKQIISNHLLVSGQPRRHDILNLERKCHDAGFTLGRTGKFGIGVLSYFMIADRMFIKTRRSLEPKDNDPNGWVFETEGVGSFGELRRDESLDRGTSVELRLRKETVGGNIKKWYQELREYLVSLLRLVPCEFQLNSAIPECEPLVLKTGWSEMDDLNEFVAKGFPPKRYREDKTDTDLLPSHLREQERIKRGRIDEVRSKIKKSIRWVCEEGELPDGKGQFRIHMPYFELAGGKSLVFLDDRIEGKDVTAIRLLKGYYYKPSYKEILSWKGMYSDFGIPQNERGGFGLINMRGRYRLMSGNLAVCCELNLHDESTALPQVSRNIVRIMPKGMEVFKFLRETANRIMEKFIEENANSRYAFLNSRLIDKPFYVNDPYWLGLADEDTGERKVQKIKLPAVTSLPWKYTRIPEQTLLYKGKAVSIFTSIGQSDQDDHYQGISAFGCDYSPIKVVSYSEFYRPVVIPLWEKKLNKTIGRRSCEILTGSFPPTWNQVAAVYFEDKEGFFVFNESFPLLRKKNCIKEDDWEWAIQNARSTDPLEISDILLSSRERAIAWILTYARNPNKDIWDGLTERLPGYLEKLWRHMFNLSSKSNAFQPIVIWVEAPTDSRFRIISPNGWDVFKYSNKEIIKKYLPDPGDNWKLVPVDEKSKILKKEGKKSRGKRGGA